MKPENILINNNVYKIADFGLSKQVNDINQMNSSFVGTYVYSSPQMLLKNTYTYKTDIWSLGLIYFCILYGYIPY